MKKTLKLFAVLLALCMVLTIVLAACKDPEPDPGPGPGPNPGPGGTTATTFMELDDYKLYLKDELRRTKENIGTINSTVDGNIEAAYQAGLAAINAGTNTATTRAAFDQAKTAMAACIPYADGIYDFSHYTAEEKTEILGLLEKYGFHTGITGVPLYGRGGYMIYRDRVTLGTENDIPGYGFGVLAEGNIDSTKPLDAEQNEAWKLYYHSALSEDPGTANYLNSQSETVGNMYGYFSASLWTVFMNAEKNGYEWAPELAMGDPVPLNKDESTGLASQWKVELRQGLKYNTLSTIPNRAAFNNTEIKLEDYITGYKLMLNAGNGYLRGNQMANETGASKIPGALEYYKETEKLNKQGILDDSEADFSKVGVSVKNEGGKWYMYFELGRPVSVYNAKYNFNSSLCMPIPKDFIDTVGVENYLSFSNDTSTTPVDNSLSIGAYTLEKWDTTQIVYKKNPNYVLASTKYAIKGLHMSILTAMKDDREAAIKEYEIGKLDVCSIPYTRLANYLGNPLVRQTTDDAVFALNMNALDQDTWIEMFGKDGTVAPHSESEYRKVVPALANEHFRQALSYALNRKEYAEDLGVVPSANFFSSDYMSDPENGIAYNSTKAHEKALSDLLYGAEDTYGYSLELARDYFRMALDELEASGAYTRGTKANPTVITIEIIWQDASQEESDHAYVVKYWQEAFNDNSVSGGCYKLEFKFWAPAADYTETYDRLKAGEFDIGFGSIGGNTLDPLAHMSINSSDPKISQGWTLNWGTNTNDPNADILVFEGERWSYDALYQASQEPAQINQGKLADTAFVEQGEGEFEYVPATGDIMATLSIEYQEGVVINDYDFVIFGYDWSFEYYQFSIKEYVEGGYADKDGVRTYTLKMPASVLAEFYLCYGIDLYVSYSIPSAGINTPTTMDPDAEVGYYGGWDLVFAAAADYGTFELNEDGSVSGSVTAALLMDGIDADQLSLILYGGGDAVDLAEYLDEEDGTVDFENGYTFRTYNFTIDAETFDALGGGSYGIELDVILGAEGAEEEDLVAVYTGSDWEIAFAASAGSKFELDKDTGLVTATLTVELMEGVSAESLVFVLRGYSYDGSGTPAWQDIELTPESTTVNEEDGTITFVFKITKAQYEILSGETYKGQNGDVALTRYQGIDVYVVLVDDSENDDEGTIMVDGDSWSYVFVAKKPAATTGA